MTAITPEPLSVFIGESKSYNLEILDDAGAAVSLTGATVYFSVRTRGKSPSTVITKTSAVADEIEVTSAAGGLAELKIVPADLVGLSVDLVYRYDVWVEFSDGTRMPAAVPTRFYVLEPVTTFA